MKRLLLPLLFLLAPGPSFGGLDDDWFDPAYIESNTLGSGTGFINVPSPQVIPAGVVSAAIHRYQVKLDYGFFDLLELGLTANVEGYDFARDGVRNQLFYGRLRLLDAERFGIGLSVGADGVGLELLGGRNAGFLPKASLESQERVYVVTGGVLPFYKSLMISGGWGTGAMPAHYFVNASKVVVPGLLAMLEYDGEGTNFGARFLLSPRVKLDLAFIHTQDLETDQPFARVLDRNIRFGITYSEPWPSRPGQD